MSKEKQVIKLKGPYKINGSLEVPGDKSISHRAIIISSLTKQEVKINNFLLSEDCLRTLNIIEQLGVKYNLNKTELLIHGCGIDNFKEPNDILYVGNSGTTIRLMSGILSACDFFSVLSGDKSINSRPMDRIITPLQEMGAVVLGRNGNTRAPLAISGQKNLQGKILECDISSAQVKSCLLFAGLFAKGITEIRQPFTSRDHTERMLEYFGADIDYSKGNIVKIKKSYLKGQKLYIPGDFSSAAFFIVAALISKNSRILIKNVGINPTRSYLINILKEMGANIEIGNEKIINNEPVADISIASSSLKAVKIDKEIIANIIDEIPILCVACAFAKGDTIISGASELRVKESDRIKAIVTEFNKIGIKITEKSDGLIIYGNQDYNLAEAVVETYSDHRIAMAMTIAALKSKNKILIKNTECIKNSFPGFKEQLLDLIESF